MAKKKNNVSLKVDLLPAIKKLEAITKRLVTTRVIGSYASVYGGQGLEFDSYREYAPGDDASLIDWKASARSNTLLIKKFVEERRLDVFFLIDTSESMLFGSTPKVKSEYAAEIVASISFAILNVGDSIGYAMFNDKVIEKHPPETGVNQFFRISKSLLDSNNYGGKYDLDNALNFLVNYLERSGTLVIIVSDFIGLKGDWEKKLKILRARFDVIAIVVRDMRDKTLPTDTGLIMIEDPFSNEQMVIDTALVKNRFEAYVKKQEQELISTLNRCGVDHLRLSPTDDFIKALVAFFTRRREEWR
ncbi:DUF58 domain-containing protein [Candidatus Woesearchaeota archaeon]|nr:DUF58 domain-containing protein [Candidatus Woesearchaeota archaeon]